MTGDEGLPEDAGTSSRTERRGARRRRRRIVVGAMAVLAVLLVAFVLWYELESHALGARGPRVVVTVRDGESTSSVIDSLGQKQVISSTLAFKFYDLFHGSPTVEPGSYALHQNLSFGEVHALLSAGPNVTEVDVVPGYTLAEVAQKVGTAPGLTVKGFEQEAASGAVRSMFSPAGSDNLEGLLGTGDYLVLPGETADTVVQQMVTRFDRDAQAAGLSTASAAALGLTPYQVITAASVVQKEGYYAFNMPKVARVIHNRLAQNITLQMDSTVLYALGQDGGPVTSKDLQIQSPYNTYLTKGLPPTPICMPSKTALTAAVNPPTGAWLYFTLVQKNGVMAFSDTYAEQLANEQLAKSVDSPEMAVTTMAQARRQVGDTVTVVGVIGSPVAHSLSPVLHEAAFAALGLGGEWRSFAFEIPPGEVAGALEDMRRHHIRGLSVTMPHKAAMATLVDACSDMARRLRAVNCVRRDDGTITGTNTDGEGFVASLARRASFDPRGQQCLVLGAGGAAHAVVLALASAGARQVAVANRTRARAIEAADLAGPVGAVVAPDDLDTATRNADLVVNATPLGMQGIDTADPGSWLPAPTSLGSGKVAADLVYAPRPTPWLAAATAAGATTLDGLGMLVHQAAAQIAWWTGRPAPVEAMWRAAEQASPDVG